jgi:alpha-tubulin suppressor-like RCC1 family protein
MMESHTVCGDSRPVQPLRAARIDGPKGTTGGKARLRAAAAAGCAVLALSLFNVVPASAAPGPAVGGSSVRREGGNDLITPNASKPLPPGVKAIAAGFEGNIALLNNGTVVAWGSNLYGQLGNGTITDANRPFAVCAPGVKLCPPGSPPSSFLQGVTAIAAGAFFNLALVGTNLYVWGRAGNGSQGSLGIGTTRGNMCNGECQTVPVEVCAVGVTSCPAGSPASSFLQGVTAFGAGTYFGLAVLNTNMVVSWGSNTSGQLGNAGVSVSVAEPIAVCAVGVKACPPGSKPALFLSGVTAVSGGDSFSMALEGHSVLAWGENRYGQLGNASVSGPDRCGDFACSKAPLTVTRLKMPASAVSAANYHSLAIVDNRLGTPIGVEAWGSNTEGQSGLGPKRGNGCRGACQTIPVAVHANWKGLTAISGGRSFSLALVGGRVLAWGDNHEPGRLGNGTHISSNAPVAVCAVGFRSCRPGSRSAAFLHGVTAISAGGTVSLALLATSTVVWGSNYRGALGIGTSVPHGSASPIRVSGLGGTSGP